MLLTVNATFGVADGFVVWYSIVQTLAHEPHAACGQVLCSLRTLSVSRIFHKVIKILY